MKRIDVLEADFQNYLHSSRMYHKDYFRDYQWKAHYNVYLVSIGILYRDMIEGNYGTY